MLISGDLSDACDARLTQNNWHLPDGYLSTLLLVLIAVDSLVLTKHREKPRV